jgi:hypothetical protein
VQRPAGPHQPCKACQASKRHTKHATSGQAGHQMVCCCHKHATQVSKSCVLCVREAPTRQHTTTTPPLKHTHIHTTHNRCPVYLGAATLAVNSHTSTSSQAAATPGLRAYCRTTTAASIPLPAYCCTTTAASILLQGYCRKHTAAAVTLHPAAVQFKRTFCAQLRAQSPRTLP